MLSLVAFGSPASASILLDEDCAQIYVNADRVGGKLNDKQTREFLDAIGCSYFSTAEGGEFGSELIMTILENSPEEFISGFDKLDPLLQEKVFERIRNPIHDGFDLEKIYSNVAQTKTRSATKSRVLSALQVTAKSNRQNVGANP